MRALLKISAICLLLTACSHNPYLDASFDPIPGKRSSLIEKELGPPDAKTSLFFFWERSGFTIESLEGRQGHHCLTSRPPNAR